MKRNFEFFPFSAFGLRSRLDLAEDLQREVILCRNHL